MFSAAAGKTPKDVKPLERDLFTSTDFYADKDLWTDPRYYRCNSPIALESMWGGYVMVPAVISLAKDAPWGRCDRDYPVASIVSPYGFSTAQEHYEALLAEAKTRGGPTQYSKKNPPPDWNGRYSMGAFPEMSNTGLGTDGLPLWFDTNINQASTIASLLTPEYQQRFVQQMYHLGNTNSVQWPLSYCWPEGLMRYYHWVGIASVNLYVEPNQVFILGNGLNASYPRPIQMNREFKFDGSVPYLNAQVPRWMGETIGFWDGDALISWTSNVQGWFVHAAPEYSNTLQIIEIRTPLYNSDGSFRGLQEETIWYDPAVYLKPVRMVRHLLRQADLNQGEVYVYDECLQSIWPIEGHAQPISGGTEITLRTPDWTNRPWAQQWEILEKGMKRPESDVLSGF